jgi:hypothetical protein
MESVKISGMGSNAASLPSAARPVAGDAGQAAPARAAAPAGVAAGAAAERAGAGANAQAEAADAAQAQKKTALPPASNGMQFVYVFDDQLHRNVVKIVDIQTQKVMPDPPQQGADAQAQDAPDAQGAQAGAGGTTRIDTRA